MVETTKNVSYQFSASTSTACNNMVCGYVNVQGQYNVLVNECDCECDCECEYEYD
jgi:hypothetical protein